MNLKERGITVGDLLIIFILIFSTTIVVKTLNKDKKTSFNNYQETVSFKKTLLSEIKLKTFSV